MPAQLPSDPRKRLAVLEHERRQAIYDAREAMGDRPSSLPVLKPPRPSLPSVDDLIGPEAPKARWKLVLAVGSALLGLGELARQIAGLLGKH